MRVFHGFGAAALLLALCPAPASACSDLPNICQQQAQQFREQLDYWATPPWGGDEEIDDGPRGNDMGPRQFQYSPDEWAKLMEEARKGALIQARMRAEEHQQKLRDDPGYRRFYEGYWLPQTSDAVAKGGPCIAHFSRQGQGVMVMGPQRGRSEAFLTFYGPQVPPPRKRVDTISVTLRQTGDLAQTMKVFHVHNPWDKGTGMIFFAVPTIEAAIAGMTDQLRFDVDRNGAPIVGIEWHTGLQARDALTACVAASRR